MKWTYLITLLSLIVISGANAQVAINETGASPDPSAILDISSTDKGLLIPRVTTIQRNGIDSPQGGLLVYDTNNESFWYYDTTQSGWVELGGGADTDWVISNNNMYSTVSGNVGIGTTSPTTKLQIINGNLSLRSQYTDAYIKLQSDEEADITPAYIWSENAKGFAVGSTHGIPQLLVNAATGKVGIGTTNPSQKLSIRDGNMSIVSEGSDSYIFLGSNELADAIGSYIWTDDNVGLAIGSTEGVPQLVVKNSNGNVGIGTTNPGAKLDVAGQIKIAGGSPGVGKILYSDANGLASWQENTTVSNINDLSDGITDVSNMFLGSYAGTQDNGDNQNTGIGINSLYWNVGGQNNTALGYKNSFRNTSGSSNTSIGNNALYFNTVKSDLVAIGDSALFNNGNNASSSNQEGNNNTAVGSKSLLYNGNGYGNTALGSHSMYENGSGFLNVALGYNSLENNTNGDHNLSAGAYSSGVNTTGSENVSLGYGSDYFNDGGSQNVIIGTHAGRGSSGNNKSGNIFIGYKAGYGESGSNKLYIDNSDNSSPLIGGDFNTDELYFNTTQLGIGTDNPNEHLEVASPTSSYGRMIVSDGGDASRNALLFVSPKASDQNARIEAYDYGSSAGLTLKFNTVGNGNSVFGGMVGIGTSSPLGALHVHSSEQNNIVYITPNNTTGDSSSIFFSENNDATNGMYWMYDGQDNHMELWGFTGGVPRGPHLLVDRNSGNMAIGGRNFADGYKLSIEGKVMCEEIRVSLQSNWPDYVFSKDYNLMPIDDFQLFIEQNGHLPNIPEAKEAETSGIDLGEMQRLLLEKVEELSLYIIEQNERIKNLEEQLNK